ncbi:MAG TPA: hypothetical protein VF807_11975 [Ktedonobacterales bacterium]
MRQGPFPPENVPPPGSQGSGTAWPPMTGAPMPGTPMPAPGGSTSRPLGERAISSGPDARMALATEASRVIEASRERDRERRRVINVLTLTHVLLALALMPGFVSPTYNWPVLGLLGSVALVGLIAFLLGRTRVAAAGAVLVIGNAIAALVIMGVLAYTDRGPVAVALLAVLLVASIVEAGLLLTPEIVVIFGIIALVGSAGLILWAAVLTRGTTSTTIYLGIVGSLVLMALTIVASRFVSEFIFNANLTLQRAMTLGYVEAQLDAARQNLAESRARITASVVEMQKAIVALLGGVYPAHVVIIEGELESLMRSFNLMLQQVSMRNMPTQNSGQINTLAEQMMNIIAQMSEGVDGQAMRPPELTHTAMDSVLVALTHMQAQFHQRLARVQGVAQGIAGAVRNGHDGLTSSEQEVSQAVEMVESLVNTTDMLANRVRALHADTTQPWRTLAGILPAEIVAAIDESIPGGSTVIGESSDHYEGLGNDIIGGSGLTGEAPALPPSGLADTDGIAPMTRKLEPLPTRKKGKSAGSEPKPATEAAATPDVPPELVELYQVFTQIRAELAHSYQALRALGAHLGKVKHTLRSGDKGVAYGLAALDSALQASDQLEQIVGLDGGQTGAPQASLGRISAVRQRPDAADAKTDAQQVLAPARADAKTDPPRPEGVPGTGELNASDLIGPEILPSGLFGTNPEHNSH